MICFFAEYYYENELDMHWDVITAYKILVVRSEGRDKFASIFIDEMMLSSKYEGVKYSHLVLDMGQWQALVNTALETSGSLKGGKFLVRLTTTCFIKNFRRYS
jgi:hypothetical protein